MFVECANLPRVFALDIIKCQFQMGKGGFIKVTSRHLSESVHGLLFVKLTEGVGGLRERRSGRRLDVFTLRFE